MASGLRELVIGFDDGTRNGRVLVTCEPNDEPERWGYPLLGLGAPDDLARGFPVVRAVVKTEAEGYDAILAWVQVVAITRRASGTVQRLVDVAPQLQGLALPYLVFGPRPALFDAPSTDAHEDTGWTAHSFLVGSPDAVMTRRVVPLCGFSWGYEVRGGVPRFGGGWPSGSWPV